MSKTAELGPIAVMGAGAVGCYYGAGLAAQHSGDTAKARGYFTKLSQLAAKGDPRPELAQARTFLAAN